MQVPAETIEALGEEGLIELFSPPGGALGERVVVPNGDDAAAYFVEPRFVSVVTTDSLVEERHFVLGGTPPVRVGRKLMAVNLSDIAAMGAQPRYALLSICLPRSCLTDTARAFAQGIQEMCRTHGVAVIGGNVSGSPGPIVLTATLIGRAEPEELVRRRGTQAGDAIFVTGHLGHARAGLHVLQTGVLPEKGDPRWALVSSLTDPKPRVAAGRALAKAQLAHAMCDVSDGLGCDLRRLIVPEGLGATLDARLLPMSAVLQSFCQARGFSPERFALEGGEDYELVFTAHPDDEDAIARTCASAGTPVSRIGTVQDEARLVVEMTDGTFEALPGGFAHF